MSTPPKSEDVPSPDADDRQEGRLAASGLGGKVMEKYRETKEHTQTHPYFWGTYILVYGSLGCLLSWRWGEFQNLGGRYRALQEFLRKQSEAGKLAKSPAASNLSAQSASSAKKDPPSA